LRRLLVLRAQGLTFAQCAKQFGRHPSGVKWIWKKHFGDLKLKRAAEMSRQHTRVFGTRSLDVLHVASAVELGLRRFVTFDERQQKLAQAAGLKVVEPSE